MPHNPEITHPQSPETLDSRRRISSAEKLLASLEAGHEPESELEMLLQHSSETGAVEDRIIADEVGGLSIVDDVVRGNEVPLLLGQQPVEELEIALSDIEEARGHEATAAVIDKIEKAEQGVEFKKTQEETYNPWVQDHSYETVEEMIRGVARNTDKIREEYKRTGDANLWHSAQLPSIRLGKILKSGENYTPEHIASWAKVQFRALKEGAPVLEKYYRTQNPDLTPGYGLSTDEQLVQFMDNILPKELSNMPVDKFHELVTSEAYSQSPLLQRAVETARTNVEYAGKDLSRGELGIYLKLKGFKSSLDFIHSLPKDGSDHEEWQRKILDRPTLLVGNLFDELEDDTDEYARSREEYFRVSEFLELAAGLSRDQAREVGWSLRHGDRRRGEALTKIAQHIEDGLTPQELGLAYEQAGLVSLERYDKSQLKLMVDFINGDETLIERLKSSEVTVVITDSTEDHNGAFSFDGQTFRTDGRTLFFEISSAENGLSQLSKVTALLQKHQIRPSTVVLGAHGSPEQTMRFGNSVLSAKELIQRDGVWSQDTAFDELLGCMKELNNTEPARLLLASCSQGSRENGQGKSMADVIAERAPHLDVYAPDKPAGLDYSSTEAAISYSGAETRRFRSDGSQVVMDRREGIPFDKGDLNWSPDDAHKR